MALGSDAARKNSASGGKGKLMIYERDFQQACYLKGHIYDGQTGLPIIGANMQILTTNNIENSNFLLLGGSLDEGCC